MEGCGYEVSRGCAALDIIKNGSHKCSCLRQCVQRIVWSVVVDVCRDFFNHEGGRNTVEFFKETQSGDGLFIALKFESRSVAKDVLNR